MAVLARRADRLADLAAQIQADGGTVLVVTADVADRAEAQAAVDRAAGKWGRLDILVNNAGIMLLGPASEASADDWQQMLAVNVNGVLNVTRAALPHLISAARTSPREVADLVTISSTAGRVSRPGAAVYSLTKFGVGAFSESLRQELQPQRVRVGVIEPGTVDTELASHVRPEVREAIARQTQDVEMLRPKDIADAVCYMVTRNRRVAVNEMLIRAGDQTW